MSLATSQKSLCLDCSGFDRWRRWFDLSFFLCGGLQNKRLGGRAVSRRAMSHLRCRFRLRPCCQVPKAVVAALGKHSIKVDTGNLTPATFRCLTDLRCPVHLPVAARDHLIHIFSEEHGEERGVLDFFTTLQCCNLVSLDLQLCSGIHAGAWQNLHGAKWLNLKKADFSSRLAERSGLKVFLFFFSGVYLSLLFVVRVQICIDLWSCRTSPSWPGWV